MSVAIENPLLLYSDIPRLSAMNQFLIAFGTVFLGLAVITATVITIVAMTKKRELTEFVHNNMYLNLLLFSLLRPPYFMDTIVM